MQSNNQYVGISNSQKKFVTKNLLYSEMEFLQSLKYLRAYKKLRKEEFALRKLLKKKIAEVKKELLNLDTLLPEVEMSRNFSKTENFDIKKRSSLDKEIDGIKKRIALLQ